jgi:penicillin-binding protein 2
VIRAGALAVVAAVLFGVLFFRLWALQVLRSEAFAQQALRNDVKEITVPAPRGRIKDADGRIMVDNTIGVMAQVNPASLERSVDCADYSGTEATQCQAAMAQLPVGAAPRCVAFPAQHRCEELVRLSRIFDLKPKVLWRSYERPLISGADGEPEYVVNAGPPINLAPATEAQISYIMERRSRFPGVQFMRTYQREYRFHAPPLASTVLGSTGRINAEQVKMARFRGYPNDATIGQSGVEWTYDRFLQGKPGLLNQSFDAAGHAVGAPYMVKAATPGADLYLTLDATLQQAAQKAIQDGLNIAHNDGELGAREGAVVAMNPKTGGILAMASWPTFDPRIFVPPFKGLERVQKDTYNQPLIDRAYYQTYSPGSTFKPFTAAAGWWAGMLGPGSTKDCPGYFIRPGDTSKTRFNNWNPFDSGVIGLPRALEISCDTFFYQIGNGFYDRYIHSSDTDQLPVMLRRFGFGATPPVDIPGASSGLVQDPLYRKENYPPGSIDADWQPGYDIQMSIGQGIDVTPLQLATAYSALANGGILPTPHFAKELRDSEGRVVKKLSFPPQRNLHLPESFLAEVRQGLYNASHSADGTSSSVFGNFKPDVAGKTGTAEVLGKADNAWYASWAPADNPEIVVVALIVGGGHGGVSAAPVAREVYSAYFHPNQKIRAQAGTDRSR